ncbi:MAG: hypothetical protein JO186_02240 [Actinobacteria bacterium]|nr:hypothetical protein [Actinomycetota bacterium]MBV8395872.1 hypothetical protein [Actinomycetota bacterium]MBV8599597.1 hypothetical protein [Actinomycetota bacterium]
MRKLALFCTAAVALVCAGIAVAHGLDSKSVKAESASFTATTAGNVQTGTCTGADGTYATSRGTYTGTISNSTDTTLNGPVTIDAESLVNSTTNLGTVTGKVSLGTNNDGHDEDGALHFEGVYSGGNVAGVVEGRLQGSNTSLLANFSAAFSATGGFTNGALGHGASGGDGVEITSGGCDPQQAPKPETVRAEGAVSAVSSTSITAAGVTCTIPTNLQSQVAALNLATGTRVELECTVANGANTLTAIHVAGGGDQHGSIVKTVLRLAHRH